jgi:hypothetical protein
MVTSTEVVVEETGVARPRGAGWWKKAISFPVFLGFLLMGAAAIQANMHLADPDTWWHARVGQRILATGHFPTQDIYSYTVHGHPWIAYEWLGEVAIGLAAHWGVSGLLAMLGALSGLLMLLLYIYGTIYTGNVKAAFAACAILLPLQSVFFTLRPQVIGYCFLLVLLILMELYRQGREKVLWAIPPLFLLWINTHGSFFLGLGILGVFWASGLFNFEWGSIEARKWTPRQSRNLLLTMLASVVLLPITPYGTQLAAYPFEMALLQPLNIANIQEWQPVNFGDAWGKAFLLIVLALFLVQVRWKPKFRLFDLVFLVAVLCESALHLRFIIVLIFAFLPWLAVFLTRWLTPYVREKDQYALNVLLIAIILGGLAFFFPSQKKIDKRLAKTYPIKAIAYLKTHSLPGPMMNEYGWGGYLIWTFGTSRPVFIDGRCDIYEYAGVFGDYLDMTRLKPDTPLLLAKYKLRSVFIPAKSILATYLSAAPGWKRVYQDKIAAIFVFQGAYPKAPPRQS